MRGHGSQWISYKINIRHPLQLKKSKSWEPFMSFQLNSTANQAHLPQNWAKFQVNGLDWQCCSAGSAKTAPRIYISSIVLGAKCLSYLKSIGTHARAFTTLIILSICTVCWFSDLIFHNYSESLSMLKTILNKQKFQVLNRQVFIHTF